MLSKYLSSSIFNDTTPVISSYSTYLTAKKCVPHRWHDCCQLKHLSMAFCKLCRKICKRKWSIVATEWEGEWVAHHKSYSDLCKSVSNGCELCTVFKCGLLDWMRRLALGKYKECSWELDDIEEWQMDRDFEGETKFWIVVDQIQPGDGEGILCDETLLGGIYYRRRSPNEVGREDEVMDFGPFFQLRAPSSPSLIEAQAWLRQCVAHHPECVLPIHSHPTRLLRIYSSSKEWFLRLIEASSPTESYAALSHCWGTFQPLRTTSENYERHKKQICASELPKSFYDAVIVAKALGIEYLWIDSLCIIQDSTADWERECCRMAAIYSGALVTIAAADAENSSEGFLGNYGDSDFKSCVIPYRNDKEDALISVSIFYRTLNNERYSYEPQSHISKRGWILQERLLSQRILSFGKNRLQWECSRFCCSDDMHYPFIINRIDYGMVEKRPFQSLVELPAAFEYWCDLVSTYSCCQLSKTADKLPALSGLAQTFSKIIGDTYLAGLWRNDIHVGLTWLSREYWALSKGDCTKRSVNYRAPSWSWASSNCDVTFPGVARKQHTDLVIISVAITLKGHDPFGQVSDGVLRVCGRLKRGVVRKSSDDRFRANLHDYDTNILIAEVTLDDQSMWLEQDNTAQQEVTGLLIVYDSQLDDYRKWTALALEEIGSKGDRRVFRRIGLMSCVCDKHTAGHGWFDSCSRQPIDIV